MQGLKGDCTPWVEGTCPDGVLHVTYPLTMLPGIQATKAKAISEADGKLLEVPLVEFISGLKALTTFQSDIFLVEIIRARQ